MTDIDIARLCAEALGYDEYSEQVDPEGRIFIYLERSAGIGTRVYDPLRDDAQAMAMVRKFELQLGLYRDKRYSSIAKWRVVAVGESGFVSFVGEDEDLNRAICECVAKMQLASNKKVA